MSASSSDTDLPHSDSSVGPPPALAIRDRKWSHCRLCGRRERSRWADRKRPGSL